MDIPPVVMNVVEPLEQKTKTRKPNFYCGNLWRKFVHSVSEERASKSILTSDWFATIFPHYEPRVDPVYIFVQTITVDGQVPP